VPLQSDRILFSGLDYLDGNKNQRFRFLTQTEIGYNKKFDKDIFYATFSSTDEQAGYEAGSKYNSTK
jgi:hypothetical protein